MYLGSHDKHKETVKTVLVVLLDQRRYLIFVIFPFGIQVLDILDQQIPLHLFYAGSHIRHRHSFRFLVKFQDFPFIPLQNSDIASHFQHMFREQFYYDRFVFLKHLLILRPLHASFFISQVAPVQNTPGLLFGTKEFPLTGKDHIVGLHLDLLALIDTLDLYSTPPYSLGNLVHADGVLQHRLVAVKLPCV